MEKIITARHFHLHDDLKEQIHGRLGELETTYPKLTSARIILDHQKSNFTAEILIRGRHLEVEAIVKEKSLELAFGGAFEKAMKQVTKHYDKIKDHGHTLPVSQLECEMEEEAMNSNI